MSNPLSLFRSLIVYAICLPLAIGLGYLLATPQDVMSSALLAGALGLLLLPVALRWHHLWLIAVWNLGAVVFFFPGEPSFGMTMSVISLGIAIVQHALDRRQKFLSVPSVTRPLLFLTAVIAVTAFLTGGIGLRVAGSENIGGRRYIWIFCAVLGYFALTSRRIPPQRVILYVSLFFLSSVTAVVTNLTSFIGPSFYFIYLFIPVDDTVGATIFQAAWQGSEIVRLSGVSIASTAIFTLMLALYGIRGIFGSRKVWRLATFLFFAGAATLGGFRSTLLGLIFLFAVLFYFEGLFRSSYLPIFLLSGLLITAVALPFTDQLPLSVQRTISFLPVKVNPMVEMDAIGSTEWRMQMWKNMVFPLVPKYLILGKGYAMSAAEYGMAQQGAVQGGTDLSGSAVVAALAGDYHNGPLSIIIPFGVFGLIGFIWFIAAGIKVLYHNHRFGDPAFRRINTFLLAHFIARSIFFCTIFGSLGSDLAVFCGILGLSVSINGGVRKQAAAQQESAPVRTQFNLRPARAPLPATR
jgi:hypothetical protein